MSADATCAGDVHWGARVGAGADPLGSPVLVPGVSRPPVTPWVIGSIAAPRPHSARTVLIYGHCDVQPPGPGGAVGRLTRTRQTCDPMQPPRRTPRRRRAPRSLPVGARPARRQAPHARHRRRDAGGRGRATRAPRARRDLGRRSPPDRAHRRRSQGLSDRSVTTPSSEIDRKLRHTRQPPPLIFGRPTEK